MTRIRCALVFTRVTGIAVGRGTGESVVNVAEVALYTRMCTGQGERRRAVIKGRPSP